MRMSFKIMSFLERSNRKLRSIFGLIIGTVEGVRNPVQTLYNISMRNYRHGRFIRDGHMRIWESTIDIEKRGGGGGSRSIFDGTHMYVCYV